MTNESPTTNPPAENPNPQGSRIEHFTDPMGFDIDMSVEAINNPHLVHLRIALLFANRPLAENVKVMGGFLRDDMTGTLLDGLIGAVEWVEAMRSILNIATARALLAGEIAEICHLHWNSEERTDWLIETCKETGVSMDELEARTRPLFAAAA
ncbi:MAG: hypothetical protein WBG08_04985 [Litorimonas sp.]